MRACQDFCCGGCCGCCSDMVSNHTRKCDGGGRMPPMTRFMRVVVLVVLGGFSSRADAGTSNLWGERGEKWSAGTSPLPDFRYAGYHSGRDPLPQVAVVTDVKKHGATGDGTTDDTKAFLSAVKEAGAKGGAVNIP